MLITANKKAQKKVTAGKQNNCPPAKAKKFQSKSSIWKPKSKSLALIALAKKSARYSNQGDFDIVQRKEKVDLNQQKNFGKIYLYLKTSQKFLSNHW